MGSGYQVTKSGLDALVEKFNALDRQVAALRSAAGILSAVIGKGGITVKDGGEIIAEGGNIRAIDAVTKNALAYFGRLLPPYKSGLLTATAAGVPFFWAAVLEDGTRVFNFAGTSVTVNVGSHQTTATSHRTDATTSFVNAGSYHRVDAVDYIMLNAPQIRPYQLGTTGIAPNIAVDVIGGVPILKLVTSSERGKTDVAPIEVDVEEVLAYQGITWMHQSTLDETPAPWAVRRNVGHHAEAMDRFPSLRQFVNYDDDGLPASVQEGRFEVALLEVVKTLWQRVNDHDARLTALESK